MAIYNCEAHFPFGFQDTNLGDFKESGAYAFIHPCISFHSKLLFLSFASPFCCNIDYFCDT